ncbi:Hypothetical_protein [Hexamita inflata]|uniref:Hypothetical_protein n=1 Tax=Hexamita inflata TaxID=28002 RepID=A0AA86QMR1_9EUKA|nr:Hypothetical protein HINF_LOCUS25972 [Hexamita inflata]CAI9962506.1 Hypothetical protein HINF_LOCUS50151 [Hexamita inflata]
MEQENRDALCGIHQQAVGNACQCEKGYVSITVLSESGFEVIRCESQSVSEYLAPLLVLAALVSVVIYVMVSKRKQKKLRSQNVKIIVSNALFGTETAGQGSFSVMAGKDICENETPADTQV